MKLFKRIVGILFLLSCLSLKAQSIHQIEGIDSDYGSLPFDANEVISRVSQQRISENREGEFLIDTNLVYGPTPEHQYTPSIVFDGINYFVVWTDRCRGGHDIYGARVDSQGVVIDTGGIAISLAERTKYDPVVAFDGTNYFVVWRELWIKEGGLLDYDIYGARVNTQGIVLDTNGMAISTAADDQEFPSVAFDGTNYCVVWQDHRVGAYYYDIYGARVSTSGTVLDTAGFAISTAANDQLYPTIAFDGTNYFVFWQDRRSGVYDIVGARIRTSGVVLDTAGIVVAAAPNYQVYPSAIFDGTNCFVVWRDDRNASEKIYGARVSQDGVVLDTLGIAVSTAPRAQTSPSLSFDGTNYLVVWCEGSYGSRDIYGARVSAESGIVLDTSGIPISTVDDDQLFPSVAFGQTDYLVVWADSRDNEVNIYGTRVEQSGTVVNKVGIAISTGSYSQWSPSVCSNGDDYLVVWEDIRNFSTSSYDIYGARVAHSGTILDPSGIAISTAPFDQRHPSVTFSGSNYFVVWDDYRNFDDYAIYGARVAQSGVLIDTSRIVISRVASVHRHPSIAFDGINYLVVWFDNRDTSWDIQGARVTPDGVVLDTLGIAIAATAFPQMHPSVDFDGVNYLAVWQEWRESNWNIYGTRLNQSGIVLDTIDIAVSVANNDQVYPTVAFDGVNYLVIWSDYRNNVYFSDIHGVIVDTSGAIIDAFAISTQPDDQISPAVAACTQGYQLLITYSGFVDSINGRPANTMRIWGKFYPFTGIAEDAGFRIHHARYGLTVYPNPFRYKTDIRFQLLARPASQGEAGDARDCELKIYDVTGRLVKEFNQLTNHQSSINQIVWDGTDNLGRRLASGIYFCRLATDEIDITEKIILLR